MLATDGDCEAHNRLEQKPCQCAQTASSAATHPRDVRDDLEGDAAAGDGAAGRHLLQEALSETLQHRRPVGVGTLLGARNGLHVSKCNVANYM